jgi:hypothetical protein
VAAGVTVNEGLLRLGNVERHGVHEHKVGPDAKELESRFHRQAGRVIDIDLVNDGGVHGRDGPSRGAFANSQGQLFATLRIEQFAVIEAPDGAIGIEDYSAGHDGAKKRAAADLIGSRDTRVASRTQVTLESPVAFEARNRVAGLFRRSAGILADPHCLWMILFDPGSRRKLRSAGASAFAFAETRRFAFEATEVIQLGSANPAGADDVDMIDNSGVHRENALDALAEANLADGDRFTHSGVVSGDYGTFEDLQALFVTFPDLDVDFDGVARPECGEVRPEILLNELAQQSVLHLFT